MFNIVLCQPEIAPNTGNLIRLCSNTGCKLHLIKPLGFELDDKRLRRAGLDYHEYADVKQHDNFDAFIKTQSPERLFAIETSGTKGYHEAQFHARDYLLFGSETKGLSQDILNHVGENQTLRIPMLPNNRSINLSNSVARVVFEAWRQCDFTGAHSWAISFI